MSITRWALIVALFVLAIGAHASAQKLSEIGRNHLTVKRLFREVIAASNRSSVRVFARGRDVALGTIVRENGYILTKASELKGSIYCQFQDGRVLRATKVAYREDHDLALLHVDAKDLEPIVWARPPVSPVGTILAVIGRGDYALATGVVGGKPRRIPSADPPETSASSPDQDRTSAASQAADRRLSRRRSGFPQAFAHDAPLRPNDCGGPVVDLDGRVVGLNIARASRAHSLAIPADVVQRVVEEMTVGR